MRRSRFQRTPSDAKRRLTPNDLFVLELLATYRYLPSSYVLAFAKRAGRSESYLIKRLTVLRHDLGVIECPPASWYAANARYRPAVYMLTPAGEGALRERGLASAATKSGNEFNHELMVSLFHASIEFGVQDHRKLSLITADDILRHPSCPRERRTLPDPFRIPVTFSYGRSSEQISVAMRHDGPPFGIVYQGKTTVRLFFPGIEADRRTEPLSPQSSSRTSIRRKLCAIREASYRQLYRKQLGIPNYLVPFITISDIHKRSIMALVDEITGGKGSRMLLFKSIPDFSSFESFPAPTGHFLTEPWERVGYPPFDIVAELNKAADEPSVKW